MNKKGCFIKIVGVGTVLIAVLAYLLQSNSLESLLKPFLNIVDDELTQEVSNNIKFVKPSAEKDSLLSVFKDYIENGPHEYGGDKDNIKKLIIGKIKVFAKDSVITINELQELKDLIMLEKENERSKKK